MRLAGIMFALSLLLGSNCAALAAAEPHITSTISVTPEESLTPKEKSAISLAAARLLVHVDQAKQFLNDKNMDAAKQQVIKAMQLGEIIKVAMPSYLVKTEVKAGSESYVDQSSVKPLLVPMVDLDEIAVLEPLHAPRHHRFHSSNAGVKPEEVMVSETRAQFDVGAALSDLSGAKKALMANDTAQALKCLDSVEGDVDMEYAEADEGAPGQKTSVAANSKAPQSTAAQPPAHK